MGPIYQLSQQEEKILVQYPYEMIKEMKIRPSSSSVGSPILFVPRPNGKGLRLCVDYRHLNDHTKKDKTPLPIMDKLCRKMTDFDFSMKMDMKAGFHLITMGLGRGKFTAFRAKFWHYHYMVMPFGLTNAPALSRRDQEDIRTITWHGIGYRYQCCYWRQWWNGSSGMYWRYAYCHKMITYETASSDFKRISITYGQPSVCWNR